MAIMCFSDNGVKIDVNGDLVLSEEPCLERGGVFVTDVTDGWFKEYSGASIVGRIIKGCFNPMHTYIADYYSDNPYAKVQETPAIDYVDHPSHYQTDKGIEVIDVIEAFTEKLTGVVAFDIGCALKYLCRWSKKNGVEDLRKAIWYLEHAIKKTEGAEDGSVHSG